MKKNVRKITGLFVLAAVFYACAACLLREAPNIVIDESLYTNLARSLLYEGRAAYRSQPIDYPYLLYPLLLVPVYWLRTLLGGDVYRWVQIFNALLITSSVFPVYLLGKECTGSEKKAFTAAVFTALMPDMYMCAYEMTEALVWPLSLWTVYFAWKLVPGENKKYGLLAGLFTGLLYAVKPGAIAMGAGIMLTLLIIRLKRKERVRDLFTGIGALLAVIVIVHLAYHFIFGYSFSALGLYSKQTADWESSHIIAAALGFPLLIVGFVCIGGGVFVVSPYLLRSRLKEENSRFLCAVTVGLLAAMLGTAILIIPFSWSGKIKDIGLHLRYLAMYLPVFIILTLSPEEKKGAFAPPFKTVLVICAVAALLLGLKLALLPGDPSTVDALSLCSTIHNSQYDGTVPGVICAVLMCLSGLLLAFNIDPRFPQKGKTLTLVLFAAFLVYNNICAAVAVRQPSSKETSADASEINGWLMETEQTPLGIMQTRYSDILTYRLESRLVRPMQQVTSEQMVSAMVETDGVYKPFVPIDQNPNKNNGLTPETNVFVLGETVLNGLELSPAVEMKKTGNGIYALLTIPEGERWVDSMLYGLTDAILYPAKEGRLFVFKACPEGSMLHLQLTGPKDGANVKVTVNGKVTEYSVGSGFSTLDVPVAGFEINIATDKDLQVRGYSIDT